MHLATRSTLFVLFLCGSVATVVEAQIELTPLGDITLADDALLMPSNAIYGRAINGLSFHSSNVTTIGDYQYSLWYRARGSFSEDLMLARRRISTGAIEIMDTGENLVNGDSSGAEGSSSWDAHNVAVLGVSTSDGRLHLSYDHHNSQLNYTPSNTGADTGAAWDDGVLQSERSSLNVGGPDINGLTYPRFIARPDGGLDMTYRTGGSGNGNLFFAKYDPNTGLWNDPQLIITGTNGLTYSDPIGSSGDRNAYLNGVSYDTAGNLHMTWTWRESAGGTNHDIMYAWSDDGGSTWRNNDGAVVGTPGSPIDLNSTGTTIATIDRRNTLMNQQAQTVDDAGGVHAIMWHADDANANSVGGFTTAPAAYFHYYRDPATDDWSRIDMPTDRAVGSRPDVAYDSNGNLYAVYLSGGPGDGVGVLDYYTEGDLVIASASQATGYQDWSIVHTDTRDWSTEPSIDRNRLLADGVLSVFVQEHDDNNTGRTGTPLHVLEYAQFSRNLVWAGDALSRWSVGGSTDWDSTGDDAGDSTFDNSARVTFDDGASSFEPHIVSPVSPAGVAFLNATNDYQVSGQGIQGAGGLRVAGGAQVALANSGNTFTGATSVEKGVLTLSGAAQLSGTSAIDVHPGATLNTTALSAGALTLSGQQLTVDGDVVGNVVAANGSLVQVNSINSFQGDLTAESGSLVAGAGRITGSLTVTGATVRVGAEGLQGVVGDQVQVIDDFNTDGLGQYTQTVVLDNDLSETNVGFFDSVSDSLSVGYSGTVAAPEQTLLLRGDSGLGVGQTLVVDVDMDPTGQQMDFGLAVSSTDSPAAASGGDSDTRDTFEWASISVRPSANNIRVNQSVEGQVDTASGVAEGVSETTVASLYITRVSASQFVLGYIDDNANADDRAVVNFTDSNTGAAIGFYADLRFPGVLGSFDNLRVISPGVVTFAPETLTIEDDYTQGGGAELRLDIAAGGYSDLLSVGGKFTAGGTLALTLDDESPPLAEGDAFDLLDFASFAGAFESAVLPTLAEGLLWDSTSLAADGILRVVAGLPGDFNLDGSVDSADFTVWRDSLGKVGSGLAADADGDFRVDTDDYLLWRSNFGETSAGIGGLRTQVPEPTTLCLLVLTAAVISLGQPTNPGFRRRQPASGCELR